MLVPRHSAEGRLSPPLLASGHQGSAHLESLPLLYVNATLPIHMCTSYKAAICSSDSSRPVVHQYQDKTAKVESRLEELEAGINVLPPSPSNRICGLLSI